MIIKVEYNKDTNELVINGDINAIELNTNSVIDTDTELSFEIALDTSQYELDNEVQQIEE
jgi:hypothetical protein